MSAPLVQLFDAATNLQKNWEAWESLVKDDEEGNGIPLLMGLREGLERSADPEVVSRMEQVFRLLSTSATTEKIKINYTKRQTFVTGAEDLTNVGRLQDNARALVATALAAAAFRNRKALGGIGSVVHWWQESARLLKDSTAGTRPAWAGDWPGTIEELARKLASDHNWNLTATRYWTAWWLAGDGHTEGTPRRIPVAGIYGPEDREVGFVAELVLEALNAESSRLIEHPLCAVSVFSNTWLKTLETVFGNYGKTVSWYLQCPDSIPWQHRVFSGDSHGGAAAWGFWHVGLGKVPDDRIAILASAQPGPEWPHKLEALILGEVGGVRAKVKAIKESGRFDTIVVAGRRDKELALKALSPASDIVVGTPEELLANQTPA